MPVPGVVVPHASQHAHVSCTPTCRSIESEGVSPGPALLPGALRSYNESILVGSCKDMPCPAFPRPLNPVALNPGYRVRRQGPGAAKAARTVQIYN